MIVAPFFVSLRVLIYSVDMRKLFIFIVAAVLCAGVLSCADADVPDVSGEGRHDPEKMAEYTGQWKRYNALGEDDSLIMYTRPLLRRSLNEGDTLTALYCGVYIAQAWMYVNQIDSTLICLQRMQDDMDRSDDDVLKYLYYCIWGNYIIKADMNYVRAMEYYQRAYRHAVATGKTTNQLSVLLDITYLFYVRSDVQGLDYARDAYELSQMEGEPIKNKCSANTMMAMMSHISGDDSSAIRYIDAASALAKEGRLITHFSLIYKVYADIYAAAGQYGRAARHYERALQYAGYADAGTESFVYLDYGRMLRKMGRESQAKNVLEHGLEISYGANNHECRKELLSSLVDNALALGNKDDVARYLENYRSYLDSVSDRQREHEFNAMLMSMQKIEYENMAQAVELEHLRSTRRFQANVAVLVIIIIVVLFISIIYRRQRNMYRLLVEQYQKYAEQVGRESISPVKEDEQSNAAVQDADRELFERVEKIMREQKIYRKKSLTRDELAEMLKTNRTYLSRAINNISGKSFNDYLNTWRVIEATLIMADKTRNVPLKQLAEELGYSSISVFYRSFQKETGVTAGKYMKEVRDRQ